MNTEPQRAREVERPSPLTGIANAWLAVVAVVIFTAQEFDELGRVNIDLRETLWLPIAVLAVVALVSIIVGLVQWRTVTFIVDDEFRIERRLIAESITRIDFTKVQSVDIYRPLAARVLGLAEVRVDVGGGAPQKLRFLRNQRAEALRDHLLARMEQEVQHPPTGVEETLHTPAAQTHEVVYQAQPGAIILGAIGALGLAPILLAVFFVGAVPIASTIFRQSVPLAVWIALLALVWQVPKELITNWGFMIARTQKGLRIERGLISKVQMTLRPGRVQAISLSQTLLQRLFRIYRVRITVLGNDALGEEASHNIDMLTPAGTWDEARHVVRLVWPNVDPASLQFTRQSERGKRLSLLADHWFTVNERLLATRHLLLSHSINLVPYARIQGLSLSQGPLQRWLQVGALTAGTISGPVNVTVKHLEIPALREIFVDVLERARTARGNPDAELTSPPDVHSWAPPTPQNWAPPNAPASPPESWLPPSRGDAVER